MSKIPKCVLRGVHVCLRISEDDQHVLEVARVAIHEDPVLRWEGGAAGALEEGEHGFRRGQTRDFKSSS